MNEITKAIEFFEEWLETMSESEFEEKLNKSKAYGQLIEEQNGTCDIKNHAEGCEDCGFCKEDS